MPEAIGVEGEGRTGVPRGLCSLVTAKRAASAGGLPWQLYLIPTTMPEYPSPYHHLPPILTLSHTHTHTNAHTLGRGCRTIGRSHWVSRQKVSVAESEKTDNAN